MSRYLMPDPDPLEPLPEPEPNVDDRTPPHGPADRCCMCSAINIALWWAQACEIRDPDGTWHWRAGYRCSDLHACRDRRTAEKETL